jgi:hypothetical protein
MDGSCFFRGTDSVEELGLTRTPFNQDKLTLNGTGQMLKWQTRNSKCWRIYGMETCQASSASIAVHITNTYLSTSRAAVLATEFEKIGLESGTQRYSFSTPLGVSSTASYFGESSNKSQEYYRNQRVRNLTISANVWYRSHGHRRPVDFTSRRGRKQTAQLEGHSKCTGISPFITSAIRLGQGPYIPHFRLIP